MFSGCRLGRGRGRLLCLLGRRPCEGRSIQRGDSSKKVWEQQLTRRARVKGLEPSEGVEVEVKSIVLSAGISREGKLEKGGS